MINKKITLDLQGMDGNAFLLIGAFKKQASKEKWKPVEIREVMDEATKGDYDHLLSTLIQYTK